MCLTTFCRQSGEMPDGLPSAGVNVITISILRSGRPVLFLRTMIVEKQVHATAGKLDGRRDEGYLRTLLRFVGPGAMV